MNTPNTKTVYGQCRYCHKSLELEIDVDYIDARQRAGIPGLQSLLQIAACNKCHDYHVSESRTRERIANLCARINHARIESPRACHEKIEKIRNDMEMQLRRYGLIVSTFYGVMEVWQSEMLDLFMIKPEKHEQMLSAWRQQVKSQSPQRY